MMKLESAEFAEIVLLMFCFKIYLTRTKGKLLDSCVGLVEGGIIIAAQFGIQLGLGIIGKSSRVDLRPVYLGRWRWRQGFRMPDMSSDSAALAPVLSADSSFIIF